MLTSGAGYRAQQGERHIDSLIQNIVNQSGTFPIAIMNCRSLSPWSFNSQPSSRAASSASVGQSSGRMEPLFFPFSTMNVSPSRSTTTTTATYSSRSSLPPGRCSASIPSSFVVKKEQRQTSPLPSTNDKKKQLQVRFDPTVRGKTFECSPHDLEQTWHPTEAFCHFEEQMRSDVRVARQLLKKKTSGSPLDIHDEMTLEATPTRGIEQFLSKTTFIDRTTKQRAVLQTVLEAQQRRLPADHISILSSKRSHEARERALSYGTVDAAVAASCHMWS